MAPRSIEQLSARLRSLFATNHAQREHDAFPRGQLSNGSSRSLIAIFGRRLVGPGRTFHPRISTLGNERVLHVTSLKLCGNVREYSIRLAPSRWSERYTF